MTNSETKTSSVALLPATRSGLDWKVVSPNYWGGAQTALPGLSIIGPAKLSADALRRLAGEQKQLQRVCELELEYSTDLVRALFTLVPTTAVLFENSDADARTAAQRLCTPKGRCIDLRGREGDFDELDDDGIVHFVIDTVMVSRGEIPLDDRSGVMLPHVTETGRVVPLGAIRTALASCGLNVALIVGGTQAMGRLDGAQSQDPLSFCDAYYFNSSKGLGGLAGATVLLVDQSTVEAAQRVQGQANLPQLTALREAVRTHFQRGDADSFDERRRQQLDNVAHARRRTVQAILSLGDFEVLNAEPEMGKTYVDSIVCFRATNHVASERIDVELQNQCVPVTTSGVVAGWLRLDIPEYRALPSIAVFKQALQTSLSTAGRR